MKIVRVAIIFLMTVKTITGLFTPTPVYASAGSLICPGTSGDYAAYDGIIVPASGGTGKMSVEFWFKTDTNSQSEKGFVSHGGSPTSDSPHWFWQRNGTTNRFYNGSYATSGTINFTNNQWHHLYFGADDENDTIYFGIDGTVTSTTGASWGASAGFDTYLCASYSGYIDGELDDVRISSVIRHNGNYTPPTSPYVDDADTLALYSFDEASGSVAYDSSGNGYDMTFFGTLYHGGGYYPDLTPTPTPSPTPTPIATASGFLNMPDAVSLPNTCSIWFDHTSTGDYGTEGNAVYYMTNNQPTGIDLIETYGNFCDPTDGSPCGIGVSSITGGVTLSNFGSDFPDYAFWDSDSFNGGDVIEFHTDYWIDRAYCTVGGVQYEAVTPFGKSMTNPTWASIQEVTGLKKACVDFSLTIPLTRLGLSEDWVLTIPNYFCIIFNWLVELWLKIFGVNYDTVRRNVLITYAVLDTKIPFAYTNTLTAAFDNLTASTPSGIANLPAVDYSYDIPYRWKDEWHTLHFLDGTFRFASYSAFQPQIDEVRDISSQFMWLMTGLTLMWAVFSAI